MNKKLIVLGIMLFAGVAVAMNDDDTDTTPREEHALKEAGLKVDLAALNNDELRESPVRSASMPSPRPHASCPGSPRSGNTSPRVSRFLSQHTFVGQMDKTVEGSVNAIQRLRDCESKLMALQGGTSERQTQIRVMTDDIRKLTDKLLEMERSHADDQRVISEAVSALKDAIKFLQLTTQVKKANSQPLRISATRVAFAQSTAAAPAAASSPALVVAGNEKGKNTDDETSCPSDDEHTTTEETE